MQPDSQYKFIRIRIMTAIIHGKHEMPLQSIPCVQYNSDHLAKLLQISLFIKL